MSTANIAEDLEYQKKFKQMVDYMYGVERRQKESFGQTMGSVFTQEVPICAAFMGGIHGIGWLLGKTNITSMAKARFSRNGEPYSVNYQRILNEKEAEKKFLNKLKGENWWETTKNQGRYKIAKGMTLPKVEVPTTNFPDEKSRIKWRNSKLASDAYDKPRRILEEIKAQGLKGDALKAKMQEFYKEVQKAEIKINQLKSDGKIKATNKFQKVKHWVKKKTGVYRLKGKILNTRKGFKVLKYAKSGLKGNALFAAISVLVDLPKIFAARQIDKANKEQGKSSSHCKNQIKKTAIKTVAGVGGFALGSAMAGAALGATCGSVVPVVGNIVGFIGGMVVGAIAGHIANNLTNCDKDETEVAKEKNSDDTTKEAMKNPETRDEILASAMDSIQKGEIKDKNIIKIAEELLAKREAELANEQTQHAGYKDYAKNEMLTNPTDYSKELTQLAYLKAMTPNNMFSKNMYTFA